MQPTEADQIEARKLLHDGAEAYTSAQYDLAIDELKRAKKLDPSLLNVSLYLGTIYAAKYAPGNPSEGNRRYAEQAIAEFTQVIQKDPTNLSAIDGLGAMLYHMGTTPLDREKLEESKSYHKSHARLRPDDPIPYYWIAVIDWTIAYHVDRELRTKWSLKTSQPLPLTAPLPEDARQSFVVECQAGVDEGMAALNKSIELKPDYDDAMAYLSLLYRMKADMATSPEERDADLYAADRLVDRVKETKQKRMNAPSTK